jgi:hypothetical protein
VLGLNQAPKNAPLIVCTSPKQPIQTCTGAVPNTLNARNYSEVVTESTAQGTQTDYLTYEAPDKLGGYVENGSKRTYVYVIGSVEYQSLTVSANASTKHLVFYRQTSQGATTIDPVHNYLRYAQTASHITTSAGGTYTFTLSQDGETGTFVYMVSGQYVSEFNLSVKAASVHMVISQVGTSPPVALPAGAKVVKAPATGVSG